MKTQKCALQLGPVQLLMLLLFSRQIVVCFGCGLGLDRQVTTELSDSAKSYTNEAVSSFLQIFAKFAHSRCISIGA